MKKRIETALRVINHLMLIGLFLFTIFCAVQTCKAQDTVKTTHNLVLSSKVSTDSILVGYTVEIDGVRHQIHVTRNKAYWYWRTSKRTGNKYKCYLTAQQKQKLGLL